MVGRYDYWDYIRGENSLISSKALNTQRQPWSMEPLLRCSDELTMITLSLVIIIISM
jgi:hypothetical protein